MVLIPLEGGYGNYNSDDDFGWGPTAVSATGYDGNCQSPITNIRKRVTVDFVKRAEWDARTTSHIDYPTPRYPMCRFVNQNNFDLEVSPTNVTLIEFEYYRLPNPVVVAYTLVAGRPVLDQANSTDPEWLDIDMNQILFISLSYAGIRIDSDKLKAYAERRMEEGA
jgi:hypothetical protein